MLKWHGLSSATQVIILLCDAKTITNKMRQYFKPFYNANKIEAKRVQLTCGIDSVG